MMARRPLPAAQKALFGPQQPIPTPRRPQTAINDPELVATVVRTATDPGYVLIGPAERVFLRESGATGHGTPVEAVPSYERDTVRQLLDAGHLTIGGSHIVHYSDREGPARSVLVPRTTRAMVTRWTNLRPLNPDAARTDDFATATRADGRPDLRIVPGGPS